MSIKKTVRGTDNHIRVGNATLSKVHFDVIGNNNIINIDNLCDLRNVLFYVRGNDNCIRISSNVRFKNEGQLWIADNNCLIEIGAGTTFVSAHIAVNEPFSKIIIGRDCMFAYDIDIRTGDSHSVLDSKTGKRINYAKDVVIGDHVWVASHCSILKGVTIANNSIVATRSVVSKIFKTEGVIIGGVPAKIIKRDITWRRERIYDENHHNAGA